MNFSLLLMKNQYNQYHRLLPKIGYKILFSHVKFYMLNSTEQAFLFIKVMQDYLAPIDLIYLSQTCRSFQQINLNNLIIHKIKQNLIGSAAEIYNLSLGEANLFIEEISNDVFFFGSTLLMALIQNTPEDRPFNLHDFDLIAVLKLNAPKPLPNSHMPIFKDDQIIDYLTLNHDRRGLRIQPLTGVHDPLMGVHDLINHRSKHELDLGNCKVPKMFLPGEDCNNCTDSHFFIRKWFWDKNLHCHGFYSLTDDGLISFYGQSCVASSFPASPNNTDIIFIKKDWELTTMETAFRIIEIGPRLISHICFGKEKNKFKLIIGYPEMVRIRASIYEAKENIPGMVWNHLIHYANRGISDIIIRVHKTNKTLISQMSRWNDYIKEEKDNHVDFIFKRKGS